MFDRSATRLIKPMVNHLTKRLASVGVSANQLTVTGFAIGIGAAFLIAGDAYIKGTEAILVSRLCDALDGAVARQTQATDAGGFLAMCVWPEFFIELAYGFAVLCAVTTLTRIWWGWKAFQ